MKKTTLFTDETDIMDVFRKELRKIEASILRVEQIYKKDLHFMDRLSDKIADIAGSWQFIFTFTIIIILWVILNTIFLVKKPWDPYPFILLNLFLSMIAALQAPFILMSQNRSAKRDQIRAELDLEKDIRDLNIDQKQLEILLKLQKDIETLKKNRY